MRQFLQPIVVKCEVCNENFNKLNWNHRFCDACRLIRDKAHAKRSQLKITARTKIKQKVCSHCFSLFILNRGNRIYCDRKCYQRAEKIKRLNKKIIKFQEQIKKLTGTGGFE